MPRTLFTVDVLIDRWTKEADWYKDESKFAEGTDKALYQEGRQICRNVIHDLMQLKKDQDADRSAST